MAKEFGGGAGSCVGAKQNEFVAAVADFNSEMLFNLMQVLTKEATEIGKAAAIIRLQRQLDGLGSSGLFRATLSRAAYGAVQSG